MSVKVPVVLGAIVASAFAERMWPLRPRREPQLSHVLRDVTLGALSAIAMAAWNRRVRMPSGRRHNAVRVIVDVLLLERRSEVVS